MEDNLNFISSLPALQRLKHIQQLGLCYLSFPLAVYSRWEHSHGVLSVATNILNQLATKIDITDHQCYLVKVLALCHDVGHIAGSHFADDYIVPQLSPAYTLVHEDRSAQFLQWLVHTHGEKLSLNHDDLRAMIQGLYGAASELLPKHLVQIVANSHGLDADKLDYLPRDSHCFGVSLKHINIETIIESVSVNKYGDLEFKQQEEMLAVRDLLRKHFYRNPDVLRMNTQTARKLKSHLPKWEALLRGEQLEWMKITDSWLWPVPTFLKS